MGWNPSSTWRSLDIVCSLEGGGAAGLQVQGRWHRSLTHLRFNNPSPLADRGFPWQFGRLPFCAGKSPDPGYSLDADSTDGPKLSFLYISSSVRGTLSVATRHPFSNLDHEPIRFPSTSFLHFSFPPLLLYVVSLISLRF